MVNCVSASTAAHHTEASINAIIIHTSKQSRSCCQEFNFYDMIAIPSKTLPFYCESIENGELGTGLTPIPLFYFIELTCKSKVCYKTGK